MVVRPPISSASASLSRAYSTTMPKCAATRNRGWSTYVASSATVHVGATSTGLCRRRRRLGARRPRGLTGPSWLHRFRRRHHAPASCGHGSCGSGELAMVMIRPTPESSCGCRPKLQLQPVAPSPRSRPMLPLTPTWAGIYRPDPGSAAENTYRHSLPGHNGHPGAARGRQGRRHPGTRRHRPTPRVVVAQRRERSAEAGAGSGCPSYAVADCATDQYPARPRQPRRQPP